MEKLSVNGIEYQIIKLLGKGKGGYHLLRYPKYITNI